jgi:Cu-processing system ATP-binding protein
MTKHRLQVENLSRSFRKVQALDHVTLDVAAGERLAILGHNGAGKTTLFRLILGFIRPDHGTVRIEGERPASLAARRLVSYLPENVSFPKLLTGREILTFYLRLKKEPVSTAQSLLDRVGLADAADRRAGNYSKGMRQRLGLAQALAGDPRLMLLDEPTSGLDPLSRQQFYALVDEVASRGCTVLLSSHGLSELEARTDRVVILNNGGIAADAPLGELQKISKAPLRIRVKVQPESVEHVSAELGGRRLNGQSVELLCPVSEKMNRLAAISALGSLITDFDVSQPSLDDIYRQYSAMTREETEQ